MHPTRRLWTGLGIIFVLSFAALGWLGREIYLAAPPVPAAVLTPDGTTVYTGEQIRYGQQVWLAAGGQQLGTVWGHGSYVAPDWSADWLHREAIALAARYTVDDYATTYDALGATGKAAVDARVREEMRANTYDAEADAVTVSAARAAAIGEVAAHYDAVFGNALEAATLREQYAMADDTVPAAGDRA
ncbi:MAG: nitric-oxide reductase large subunit, partial [Gammaproteobacteria bacterium]